FLTKDFHVYADHGGGLLVDPEFPYNRQVRDMSAHWTDRASEAYLDMGIWHVLLMGHVPCKQQRQYRYSAVDMVRSLIRAKDHLKIELTKRAKERAEKHEVPMPPKLKVGILIQVDRGVGCRGRKRRVTRLLPARNFRNIVGIHRPDFVNAVC
ncbi:MAG: hypothetical protein HY421_02885, partial [Candidatus Kerfeldbacteria bacterium]|nr:hypothetical protein [Candidatus Kerfeldbacteria bacterium]